MVWKWVSCTKPSWKPSTSGGPQGLILEPILLSIFGRTEQNKTDPQQATAGCGVVGDDAHSGCQAAFQKSSRGWRNGQLRTNEFQRQVQSSVFGREQPHEAVQPGTDFLESSSAEREQNLQSPGWEQVEDVTSQCPAAETANCPGQGRQEEMIPHLYVLRLHTESTILNFGLLNTRRMLLGWNRIRKNVFC